MAKRPRLQAKQHEAVLQLIQRSDESLALVEEAVRLGYGHACHVKVRTLRRQVAGVREDLRRRYLEQEVEQL